MNAWHYRTVDLSQFAGESLGFVRMINTGGAPPGQFNLYFDDIAVTSPDGTVLPVFSKTPGVGVEGGIDGPAECVSNFNVVDETSATPQDALTAKNTTTYYHGDQVGSARLLTAGGGWAVWSGTYTPYGQEINPAQINPPNFYKFTGQDRDEEEGSYLDYFGARYYSSMTGRFMSPDWNSDPDSVPYADFGNPQTLNVYSYVQNNPLSRTDPDGHACVVNADGSQTDDNSGGESCADVAAADELHPASVIVTPNGEDEPLNPYAQGIVDGIGARSGAAIKGLGYAYGASVAIGSGVGVGLAYGGTAAAGLTQLSLEVPEITATLSPLIPASGDKMQNIVARLGQSFYGSPQQAMQALTDLRAAAVSDGTFVERITTSRRTQQFSGPGMTS